MAPTDYPTSLAPRHLRALSRATGAQFIGALMRPMMSLGVALTLLGMADTLQCGSLYRLQLAAMDSWPGCLLWRGFASSPNERERSYL